MPAVRNENMWEQARMAAEEQGRGGDHAYVRAIYNTTDGQNKSFGWCRTAARLLNKGWSASGVAQMNVGMPALLCSGQRTNQGIVPTVVARANREMRELTQVGPSHGIAHTVQMCEGRYPTIKSVVAGLGLSTAQESKWAGYLAQSFAAAKGNRVTFHQMFHSAAREDNLSPTVTRALLLRANHYAKQNLTRKSLSKADDDAPDDGVVDGEYTPEEMAEPKDDGQNSEQAQAAADALQELFDNAGDDGVQIQQFADLVDQYGPDLIASMLKAMLDDGVIDYENERFYAVQGIDDDSDGQDADPDDNPDPAEKSVRLTVRRCS